MTKQPDDICQRGLVTVVPVGAFGSVGIKVLLIKGRIGRFFGQPFPDVVPAPLEERYLVLVRHARSVRARRLRSA